MTAERRPGLAGFIADVQREHPSWDKQRVMAEAKRLNTEKWLAENKRGVMHSVPNPQYRKGG